MLNFKKHSKLVSTVIVILVAALSLGLVMNPIQAEAVAAVDMPVTASDLETTAPFIMAEEQTEAVITDNVPVITGDFEIVIPFIPAGEIVLVGVLDIEQGWGYEMTLNVVEGDGIFFGVTDTPYRESLLEYGYAWVPLMTGIRDAVPITHRDERFRYVYIGSAADMSNHATDLVGLSLRLTMLSMVVRQDQGIARPHAPPPGVHITLPIWPTQPPFNHPASQTVFDNMISIFDIEEHGFEIEWLPNMSMGTAIIRSCDLEIIAINWGRGVAVNYRNNSMTFTANPAPQIVDNVMMIPYNLIAEIMEALEQFR